MPAPKAISSFSLSHVGILNGTTSAELADLFGANESSLELESDVYERQGDDKILSTARWITKGTLTVGTNYIPLPLISSLYGTAVVSSQIATKDAYTVQLWTEKGMNVAPRPVVVLAPGENEDGVPMDIKIVLYKVKFGPFSFSQSPSYKEGLAVSFEGDALLSDKDELGATFADGYGARIGKIIAVSL